MLYPYNMQEYLDLGLHAWARSRFSGCVVGFKARADTVDSTASVDTDPFRLKIVYPQEFKMPEGVKRIALVTEDLSRYEDRSAPPAHVTLYDRKTWARTSASCAT